MLSMLGTVAPYLLAAILVAVLAALVVLYLRRGRQARPSSDPDTQALQSMKVREFEALVRESFRLQGYKLIEAPRGAAESGELMLRRDRETVLVQCKHWRDRKVGVEVVHSLQRAMAARGAGGGFVLTAGRFGRDAVAFAAGCNVRLIDGPALRGLIAKANSAPSEVATR